MHDIEAKSILSPKNGMNLYRGCTHGCIYCDSRSECYGMTHPFEDVAVKQNAPALLEAALRKTEYDPKELERTEERLFALRAAAYYINRDFGFKNVSTGALASGLKPAGLEENYAGRLSLLWEPSDQLSISP